MTRTTFSRWALGIGTLLLAAVTGTPAQAQDGEALDRTPTDCILVNRVSRNQAVNDHQVVFFMRGNMYYRNDLDASCQALTAGETRLVFHYRTRSAKISRLCDYDSFTVERQVSRIGCGLGAFHPITAEEAAQLTGRPAPAASSSDSKEDSSSSSRRNRDKD